MKYSRGVIKSKSITFFEENDLYITTEIKLVARDCGEFKDKAYFLSSSSDWHIIIDSIGVICLVPTKKLNIKEI